MIAIEVSYKIKASHNDTSHSKKTVTSHEHGLSLSQENYQNKLAQGIYPKRVTVTRAFVVLFQKYTGMQVGKNKMHELSLYCMTRKKA